MVAMRTRPLIVVAIKTWPQMLTQSIAGNERNFASALLNTNEISKHSTKFQNTQRNFKTLNETWLENSFHQTKYCSKFRVMFRTISRNFEHVKTIALRNFFETSKNFRSLQNIAGFCLNSSKFALNTFAQYCIYSEHFHTNFTYFQLF